MMGKPLLHASSSACLMEDGRVLVISEMRDESAEPPEGG